MFDLSSFVVKWYKSSLKVKERAGAIMSKKVSKVQYELDPQGIKSLSTSEIKIILRGAEELIMNGGRAMLAKILAGSKDKKLLELELNHCPVYGAFKGISQKDILAKIDWMILNGYLAIEYDYRLPLLVFTDKGWAIERETYAEELLGQLNIAAKNQEYEFVETLKDRNRGMILLLLEKIAASGNKDLVFILDAWRSIEYKKVRTRIKEVIDILGGLDKIPTIDNSSNTISFSANKKWLSLPKEIREKLERNVWCVSCNDVVRIEKYIIKEVGKSIALEGKCNRCGQKAVRVIDM